MQEAGPGHVDYSYQYMRGTIIKYLQDKNEKKVDEQRNKEVQNANKGNKATGAPAIKTPKTPKVPKAKETYEIILAKMQDMINKGTAKACERRRTPVAATQKE